MDPKTRTLEALAIIAEAFGVEQDLAALQAASTGSGQAAGNWQPAAVAMLAEAVAAILIDQRANQPAATRDPRQRVKLARGQRRSRSA